MAKIGIVGTGMVGASAAYSILHVGVASELILVDANRRRAEGEAMDLAHAMAFNRPCNVRDGDFQDLAGCEVVVISAGAAQKPGETRPELVGRNAAIFRDLVPKVVSAAPTAILVIATNPVDVMTEATLRYSGLPVRQVIGSGTILDTARFRTLLGRHWNVDPRNVHAYIIGEHGDTEVPVWSGAEIAGVLLDDYGRQVGRTLDRPQRDALFEEVRTAAYHIIARKSATYYAIGCGLMRIVEAIVRDARSAYTLSTRLAGQNGVTGTCLSLPTVIGRRGVEAVLALDLDDTEAKAFRHSADVLADLARKAL